jgi:glycerophosphoryl diester phosphodiesterase
MKTIEEFVINADIFIVAHRGSSGTAPENTMASFNEAIQSGASMIETDIQFSADDKVVIFHDGKLDRTSNGTGFTGEKNYDELYQLDAGSWFDPKFAGEHIPLLKDLIELTKDKCYLNVEIKNRKSSRIDHRLDKILQVIYDNHFEKFTLFSSFDHGLLKKLKEIDKNAHTAVIKIPFDWRKPSTLCSRTKSEAFVCSLKEVNRKIVEDARAHDIYLGVYSVDNVEQLEIVRKNNIKAIVTNYPARMRELLSL